MKVEMSAGFAAAKKDDPVWSILMLQRGGEGGGLARSAGPDDEDLGAQGRHEGGWVRKGSCRVTACGAALDTNLHDDLFDAGRDRSGASGFVRVVREEDGEHALLEM